MTAGVVRLLLFCEAVACRNPVVERLRQPSEIFPIAMCLRRGALQQARVCEILDSDVSFRVSDAKLPAVHITLTRFRLDIFPVEFEPSAHMRAIIQRPRARAAIPRSGSSRSPTLTLTFD